MNRARVILTIHEADLFAVAAALFPMESLRMEPCGDGDGSSPGEGSNRWTSAPDRLEELQNRIRRMIETLEIRPPKVRPDPLRRGIAPDRDAAEMADALSDLEDRVADWGRRNEDLENKMERARAWHRALEQMEPTGLSLRRCRSLTYLWITLGHVPTGQMRRVELISPRTPMAILPLSATQGRTLVAAAALPQGRTILERVLTSLFFEPLPPQGDTAAETLQEARENLASLERQGEELRERRDRLSRQWRGRLIAMWDRTDAEKKALALVVRSRPCRRGVPSGVDGEAGREPYRLLSGTISDDSAEQERLIDTVQGAARRPHAVCIDPSPVTEAA